MKRRSSDPAALRGPRAVSDGEALLAEILDAPDRDRIPGARPVVSVHEQEDSSFLAAVEERRVSAAKLSRRGAWHGEWAEFGPTESDDGLAELAARWHAARPIVLAGAVSAEEFLEFDDSISGAAQLHAALQERRGLRAWLAELAPVLAPDFLPRGARARLFDEERDLERLLLESVLSPARDGRTPRGRKIDDLWVKSSWLSTAEGDDSLRVRVSFGRERDDDASGDLLRHRLASFPRARSSPRTPRSSSSSRG